MRWRQIWRKNYKWNLEREEQIWGVLVLPAHWQNDAVLLLLHLGRLTLMLLLLFLLFSSFASSPHWQTGPDVQPANNQTISPAWPLRANTFRPWSSINILKFFIYIFKWKQQTNQNLEIVLDMDNQLITLTFKSKICMLFEHISEISILLWRLTSDK